MVLSVGSGLFFSQEFCCPLRKYQSRSKAHWHRMALQPSLGTASSCCWQDGAWTSSASSSVVFCTGAKHCGYSRGKAGSWRTQMPSSGLDFCSVCGWSLPWHLPWLCSRLCPVCRTGLGIRLTVGSHGCSVTVSLLNYPWLWGMSLYDTFLPGVCSNLVPFLWKGGGGGALKLPALLARKLVEWEHSSLGRKM